MMESIWIESILQNDLILYHRSGEDSYMKKDNSIEEIIIENPMNISSRHQSISIKWRTCRKIMKSSTGFPRLLKLTYHMHTLRDLYKSVLGKEIGFF
jgi:hypothetical protein